MAELVTLGWQVADWIETLLCHGPGDVEGDPIELDDEFLAVLARAYGVAPDTGRRLVRRYVLSRAKGRAKSELAGMIVCAESLGPVRFDHWAVKGETSWWGYQYEPGEPVGVPVKRPFVRCLATEESQAGNTYENVTYMLSSEAASITHTVPGIDVGLTRVFLPGGGEIRPSTASNAAKDGGKETFAVFDETHLYVLPDLKAMHRTVRRNLRKRRGAEGWSLETTTMYELGARSIAEETFEAVDTGQMPDDVVFDHRQGPDPDRFDWDDDDAWLAGLREAYGPAAAWMDLEGILAEIRDPTNDPTDSVRYFLNRGHAPTSDVAALSDWDELAVTGWSLQPGDAVTVGFDGSERDDSTGIVITRGVDGFTATGKLWERPIGVRDWEVPRGEVHDAVADLFATYQVVRMYCDPRYWETDVDGWAATYGDKVVLEIPNSDARIAKMADRFDGAVRAALQARRRGDPPEGWGFCHDGGEDLRRHVANARRQRIGGRTGRDRGWKPTKKKPDRKIDLLSAAMLAHEARGDAIAAGDFDTYDPLDNIW